MVSDLVNKTTLAGTCITARQRKESRFLRRSPRSTHIYWEWEIEAEAYLYQGDNCLRLSLTAYLAAYQIGFFLLPHVNLSAVGARDALVSKSRRLERRFIHGEACIHGHVGFRARDENSGHQFPLRVIEREKPARS